MFAILKVSSLCRSNCKSLYKTIDNAFHLYAKCIFFGQNNNKTTTHVAAQWTSSTFCGWRRQRSAQSDNIDWLVCKWGYSTIDSIVENERTAIFDVILKKTIDGKSLFGRGDQVPPFLTMILNHFVVSWSLKNWKGGSMNIF